MRTKLSFIVLMLLFCLSVFGQQSINVPTTRKSSTSLIQSSVNQQETIYQLQAENQELQNRLERMEKDHERLEMEVDFYRNDIRANMSQWLTILSIIMGLIGATFGIGVPILINRDNSKRLESRFLEMKEDLKNRVAEAAGQATRAMNQTIETTKQATEAKSQAAEAKNQAAEAAKQAGITQETLKEMNNLKEQVTKIQKKINKDASYVVNSANNTKASEFFVKALNEKDRTKAIALFTQATIHKKDFYEAFSYRAYQHKLNGNLTQAENDYNKAININNNYAEAYNGLANVYLEKKEYDKALDNVNKALIINDRDHLFHDTKGEIYLAKNELEEAKKELEIALTINPSFVPSLENMAKYYHKMAEIERDEAKKSELLANAKEYKEKADKEREKEK